MNDKKIILKDLLPFIVVCAFMPFIFSGKFVSSVKNGLNFYALVILPSAFLIFFITAYISRLNVTKFLASKTSPFFLRAFKVNSYGGLAFIIGLVSGYPAGAKIVADFTSANLIEREDAKRVCCLVSTPPISFTIFTLGNVMLGSTLLGLKIYLTCLSCTIITAFLFCFSKKKVNKKEQNYALNCGAIYDSAYSACITALLVGALIILFYVLCDVLEHYGVFSILEKFWFATLKDSEVASGLTYGIIESNKGLKILTKSKSVLSFPLCCFIVSLSGLSNLMQSVIFLKKAKIKTARFIISKIFCAVLSFLVALFFCCF